MEKEYKIYDGIVYWKYPCPRCIGGCLVPEIEKGSPEPVFRCSACGYELTKEKKFRKIEHKERKKRQTQVQKEKKLGMNSDKND